MKRILKKENICENSNVSEVFKNERFFQKPLFTVFCVVLHQTFGQLYGGVRWILLTSKSD